MRRQLRLDARGTLHQVMIRKIQGEAIFAYKRDGIYGIRWRG